MITTLTLSPVFDVHVNIPELQRRLTQDNVMVHFPDEYVPEDKTLIIHGKKASAGAPGHI